MLEFVLYRRGWRQPLDPTSECEVWCGLKLVGILPGDLICQVLSQFISTTALSMVAAKRLSVNTIPDPLRFPLASMIPSSALSASLPRLVGVHRQLRGWRKSFRLEAE